MSLPEKPEKKDAALLRGLREKYAARLAGVKLRPPELPAVPAVLPETASRKYPVLQELAAARQEIQDEFSKGQLEFNEIKLRLEDDMAAVSVSVPVKPPARPDAEPAKEPVPGGSPAAPRVPGRAPAPEPVRAEPARSGFSPAWLIAAAALCVAAFGLFKFFGNLGVTSFLLPPTGAAGLCLDQDSAHVYFADPGRQLLFTVSVQEKRVKAMQPFPAQGIKALAFDGTYFWTSDGTSISRHGLTGNYAVLGVYKAEPGTFSICREGKDLWAASSGGKLTRYAAGESLQQEAVFPLPEGSTAGISVSGGKLWLLDPESGKLSAYKPGVKSPRLTEANVKSLLPRGAVAAFAVAGESLWVISENPVELLRIDLKRVKFY